MWRARHVAPTTAVRWFSRRPDRVLGGQWRRPDRQTSRSALPCFHRHVRRRLERRDRQTCPRPWWTPGPPLPAARRPPRLRALPATLRPPCTAVPCTGVMEEIDGRTIEQAGGRG